MRSRSSPNSRVGVAVVGLLVAIAACKSPPAPTTDASVPATASASASASASAAPPSDAPEWHSRIDGHAFPDGVLSLTWDDGPDVQTLAIARMLAAQKIRATFFVVGEWRDGVSEEPGESERSVFGAQRTTEVLGALVKAGHRLGNHTEHHALLKKENANRELEDAQRAIDPFLTNGLRLFRAPGGAFTRDAESGIASSTYVAQIDGPVHWDIDGKDWECSLYCRSDDPAHECEPLPFAKSRTRVKASVVAKRYLDAIERARHGIVLFHDRVGHVGSTYALDVAKNVVPALAKGSGDWVFVAPVMRFARLTTRRARLYFATLPLTVADVDGDGIVDVCDRSQCARGARAKTGTGLATTTFEAFEPSDKPRKPLPEATDAMRAALPDAAKESVVAGDINGDGRLDACGLVGKGVSCVLARPSGAFTTPTAWAPEPFGNRGPRRENARLLLADLGGDGRADLCIYDGLELACGDAP